MHQRKILIHSFHLSKTLFQTGKQIGEQRATNLEVRFHEVSAVMHSAMHCKFEIVTIKAIKAMF